MHGAGGELPPAPPTGYVVHTLACARWCVAKATDFRSAILLGLGDEACSVIWVGSFYEAH